MPISEAETRKKFIDTKLENAGWHVLTTENVIERNKAGIEIKTSHMKVTSETPNGNGRVDYVLFGNDGKPLAVVEAKKTSVNEEIGRVQACLYADALEEEYGVRPVIYYTNGYEIRVIDGIYPSRIVFGFHTREDLEHIIQKRSCTLSDRTINPAITDRYYQEEAINKVLDNFGNRKSRSLIVLATGTGKTRVSCSLSDIFLRNNFCKRILFLADRKNLVKQAKEETFDVYLPSTPSTLILEGNREELHGERARLVFSTYQSMLSIIQDTSKNPYSVGYFDLIIVDEAHRSLFNKYAEIFAYFDALMIGLTATPRKEIHKSTYKVFNIDDDTPNYEYEMIRGVKDGYLTYYRALDRTPDILKNGLTRENLSDEEKEKYDDLFSDDGEEPPEHIEGKYFYSTITNLDTIRKVLRELMDEGLYTNNGDVLGKTIIFAKDKKHADLIVDTFRQMYPELCLPESESGIDYCVAIYDGIRFNEVLQREFKVGQKIRIVVSVDMMDTGVDVPDVVNLVFFKKVFSVIKFWQMVGRGTRICKNLNVLSPSKSYFERTTNDDKRSVYQDKTGFLIFDICGVFEYFRLHPEGKKSSSNAELSLSQKIFLSKVRVFKGLQKDYSTLSDKDKEFYQMLRKNLNDEVLSLNDNFIGVQSNISYVEKYRNEETWHSIGSKEYLEIKEHIAPLIQGTIDLDSSKRFDYICYQFMSSRHDSETDATAIAKVLYKLLVKGLLETKLQREEVAEHEDELRKVASNDFLNASTVTDIEDARKNLRDLMRYIEPPLFETLISDFTDKILDGGDADGGKPIDTRTFMPYADKLYVFVKDSLQNPPYSKIHQFEPLSINDFNKIEEDFKNIDEVEYSNMFSDKMQLAPYVRRIIGISQLKLNAFVTQYKDKGFNELQLSYIRELLQFISQNGSFEREDLLSPELDFDGILDSEQINELVENIEHHLYDMY